MQKTAVVHFPKIDTKKIDTFRKKYDPGFKIIPPHITLVSPISNLSENQLIEYLESTIKGTQSFPIHITGLTKTADDHLFLKIREGNEQIVNLHNKLYSGILKSYNRIDLPFEPHITLGFFKMNNSKLFDKAYVEAEKMNIDVTCNFDQLSIIKGDGISPAKILKTIDLHNPI